MNKYVRNLLGMVFQIQPTQQITRIDPPSSSRSPEEWRKLWQAKGFSWRTEPEIDANRQRELSKRRAVTPDIEKGIYPFGGLKLSRADVEWLLATHENGQGPVDWSDGSQQERTGLDLRGADLCQVDLRGLPLARLCGGLAGADWAKSTKVQRQMAGTLMKGVNLQESHLEGAILCKAHLEDSFIMLTHLEKADLAGAHLEGVNFYDAYLDGANLQGAFFNAGTYMQGVSLGNEKAGFISLANVRWGDVNLALVEWSQLKMLGEEYKAKQRKHNGVVKQKNTRLNEYEQAVRANRQLAIALQNQGLNEDAARFAYRAQVLQGQVWWFLMTQSKAKLKQRGRALGGWLFSWFLFIIAGYGYRLWRSFLVYVLVIIGFTTVYYLLGASFKSPLSLVNALGLSMTSFHGRGFFPGITQLDDTLTILASIEAFVGLVLEATFIATLTQRFFGK